MAEETVADVVGRRRSDELISCPRRRRVADTITVIVARDVDALLVINDDGINLASSDAACFFRGAHARRRPASTPLSLVMTPQHPLRVAGHDHRGGTVADAHKRLPAPSS